MADPAGQITEFSAGLNQFNIPSAIVAGPDGNLWFTDQSCNYQGACAIGRINPSTGQITEFSKGLTPGREPEGIAAGPDGNLWFTERGFSCIFGGVTCAIGRITTSGRITEFSTGLIPGSETFGIAAGPDGNLWFTEDESTRAIGRINPSTGQITEFSAGLNAQSAPYEIAPGPDGNLWFTDDIGGAGAIGRITTSGQITEFSTGLTPRARPFGMATGPDGNLWFTEFGSKEAIGRITTSGQIAEFSLPANTGSSEIAAGPDGNLWFTGNVGAEVMGVGAIGRIGAGAPPAMAAPPALSGPRRAGAPESCRTSFSIWAGIGPSASLFSFDGFRWVRDGVPIAGQRGQSYTPTSADVGHQLSCAVAVTYPLPFLVTAAASSPAITVQPPLGSGGGPGDTGGGGGTGGSVVALRGLKVSPRRFSLAGRKQGRRCVKPSKKNERRPACTRRVPLTVRYTLNTAARVTFRINGGLPGRKVAGRCVMQSGQNRRHRRCTRHMTLPGSTARAGKAGANRLVLVRKLAPGRYTLTASPIRGRAQQVTFKIVP